MGYYKIWIAAHKQFLETTSRLFNSTYSTGGFPHFLWAEQTEKFLFNFTFMWDFQMNAFFFSTLNVPEAK